MVASSETTKSSNARFVIAILMSALASVCANVCINFVSIASKVQFCTANLPKYGVLATICLLIVIHSFWIQRSVLSYPQTSTKHSPNDRCASLKLTSRAVSIAKRQIVIAGASLRTISMSSLASNAIRSTVFRVRYDHRPHTRSFARDFVDFNFSFVSRQFIQVSIANNIKKIQIQINPRRNIWRS